MSSPPKVRRTDKLMSDARIGELLSTSYCGRLGTVGQDGAPYVCPLLYVWMHGQIWLHNTSARGHLQDNVRHEPRVCFEIDMPGRVFAYGRFQCDTSIEYQSVLVFGHIGIIEDRALKTAFFDALMHKYYGDDATRQHGFYPRLDEVTVYSLTVDRLTGKETRLPAPQAQWPSADNTKSPDAVPPHQSSR
jgi:nitroimidazol reductase NimA-like FMN-containing flavoprotein (pyridoxamine 5'-phosphate oxidase superfamily)